MTDTSLRRAGLILISTTVLAKVVGFLREAVIASTYGTSHVVDVYLAAMTLPAMAATIVFHSIPNAFVPLFSGSHGYGQARRQAWGLLGVMGFLSAAVWILAVPVASLTNAGFPGAARAETVVVLRITSAAIALATIEALARSRLLAQRRFARAGLSLIWQSVVMIVAVWSYPSGGPRTLAWGFVAGAAAAALWNLLPGGVSAKGTDATADATATLPGQTGLGWWVPIILLADSIPQLYALVDRHFGSFLAEGSIAALQYANLVAVLPISIFGLTLGTAILPYLSAAVRSNERDRSADVLDRAVRWSLIAVVPMTVWLLFFSQQVTGLLYERGAFNEASRLLTASTLSVYSLGLVPNVLAAILAKVFYSSRRWGPIMLASVASVFIKWALSLWWVGPRGTVGLAAASAAGALIGAGILFGALPRALVADRWIRWCRYVAVLSLVTLLGSLGAAALFHLLPGFQGRTAEFLDVAIGVFAGVLLLFLGRRWIGIRELTDTDVSKWLLKS